ncbi:MAG: F0F1 ATP synthase subunit delta [Anaerolineales bacterium]|nr:F0F1 ATP synthase subunit delta [Anaerolineales bacterium]
MPNERLAQTYAQAIFDQAMADWLTSLKTIAASLARANVTDQLDNASLDFSKKQELLRPLFASGAPEQIRNLVSLLASKNHVHLLPQVIAEFDRFAQRTAVGARATVTSAVPLIDAEKTALETKLRVQFGNDLAFEYSINPEILGGMIVRVGDKVIDGSVAGKLAELKEKLK